jgi:hypothetical protein
MGRFKCPLKLIIKMNSLFSDTGKIKEKGNERERIK